MNRGAEKNFRKLLIYVICWTITAVVFFVFVRLRRDRLYSDELYESLLTTVSRTRPMVDDPCLYSISGDPVAAGDNFAKVFLFCNKNEMTANSFYLGVLRNDSYRDMLTELGRINSFGVEFVGKDKVKLGNDKRLSDPSWKCFSDHERIPDFSESVKKRSRVECFFNYTDTEIKGIYETI